VGFAEERAVGATQQFAGSRKECSGQGHPGQIPGQGLRPVLRDNEFQQMDAMIDVYAAISANVQRLSELEDNIATAYRQVCNSRAEFDSFNSILGRGYPKQQQWTRHVAWIAQHALGHRAHCVGQKILQQRDGHFFSPMVEQLGLMGFGKGNGHFLDDDSLFRAGTRPSQQIDAMVVDRDQGVVFLTKGLVYESATRGKTRSVPLDDSLQAPVAAMPSNLFVQPRKLNSLSLAYNTVRSAFPRLRVIPVILLVDEIGIGWQFQAFDLTNAMAMRCWPQCLCLGSFELVGSSERLKAQGADLDDFRYLPSWANENPLHSLPVDRATRCLMVLMVLWLKQREMPDRLAAVSDARIADEVREAYSIFYPPELRRSDVVDCLERGGLIDRPAFDASMLALTPRGLARILLVQRLFSGISKIEDENDIRSHVLSHVQRQAELWADYRRGLPICG